MIANGLNPSEVHKSQKTQAEADALTFRKVFLEWYSAFQTSCSKSHAEDTKDRMEKNILPYLGDISIHGITTPDVRQFIELIQKRGAPVQAGRLLQKCSAVFQYAEAKRLVRTGLALHRPTDAEKRSENTPRPCGRP